MPHTQPEYLSESLSQDSTWSSASKLGRKVRALAHRSPRALKTGAPPSGQAHSGPGHSADDLLDLCREVARLRQKIHDRQLQPLVPWIDALTRQVENRLTPRER
jgi:hypothetical protein